VERTRPPPFGDGGEGAVVVSAHVEYASRQPTI
jgi:hypothetical protein